MIPRHLTPKISLAAAAVAYAVGGALAATASAEEGTLAEAKFIIEHNATDEDTGVQAFIDGEGWERVEIVGPNGVVLQVEGRGPVNDLGLTELFFESVEPENIKVPIGEVLAMFPAGTYTFQAAASKLSGDSGTAVGTAQLTHAIPAGVKLVQPAEDATVPKGDVRLRWEASNKALDGATVDIIAYQLIVETDEDPHPHMIGNPSVSMYLPASVMEITVPAAFFEPDTEYEWEVLAIEASGNQTLKSRAFTTE